MHRKGKDVCAYTAFVGVKRGMVGGQKLPRKDARTYSVRLCNLLRNWREETEEHENV